MGRILAVDYGTKRSGVAVTDILQITANGLAALPTAELLDFLDNYCRTEDVEEIVLGYPTHADGTPTFLVDAILKLKAELEKRFSDIPVILHDERFTSVEAKAVILKSGAKKKKRRDKSLVDKVSAVLILQDYLGHL
ncbi:MAG: Holliday junction resolvase RuvX [Bacteroidota bacterium]